MERTPKPNLGQVLNNLNSGLRIHYDGSQYRLMKRVGKGYEIILSSNNSDLVWNRYQDELAKVREWLYNQ